MTPTVRAIALTAGVVLLVGCGQVYARPTPSYNAPQGPFIPFVVSMPTAAPTEAPRASETPMPTPMPVDKPPARPVIRQVPHPSRAPRSVPTSHSIAGTASWYCSAAQPVCMHGYPPGSMVAAACSRLRSAMGPGWRGRTVTVTANGRLIKVKLVDWCGSTDKVIDLYREPMRRLGGSGVLSVTVRW
jgi:hypothetical protein